MFFAVGEDSVIEAVQPLVDLEQPEGQDLERAGEGIFSVVFKTKDLNARRSICGRGSTNPT